MSGISQHHNAYSVISNIGLDQGSDQIGFFLQRALLELFIPAIYIGTYKAMSPLYKEVRIKSPRYSRYS